jgi:hypothetical protein
MPKGEISQFEQEFRDFVIAFGGEVLPEDAANEKKSADYFFPKHNTWIMHGTGLGAPVT